MNDGDFWDFAAFWDFFNSFDEQAEFECHHCGRVIKGDEKVLWIDKKQKIFKCSECNEEIKIK